MSKIDPFALQFAIEEAGEVASIADGEDPTALTDFLSQLPAETAAAITARLSTRQLDAVLAMMDPRRIGQLLLEARHADMVAVLSHLPESRYPEIVDGADSSDEARLRRLFQFPGENLAAIASTRFIRVSRETTCGALKRELEASDSDEARPIVIVGEEGTYAGLLSPLPVIRSRNAALLVATFADRVEPLTGAMPVTSALSAPQWRTHSALAVVDGAERVIGTISEAELWRTMRSREGEDRYHEGLISEVTNGYLSVCAELLETAVGGGRR